ncbi:ribosomal protein L49/IMG2 [Auriculariales sp. MPI-PUGE-AT-0066]|nr:ribosomal protein L49/IMG2 [Auriculariales sp. MPI-PUGE-AT-0066]
MNTSALRTALRGSYFVPRNTNGSVPVYSDIRNNGTKYLLHVRNIDGDVAALAEDLKSTLFTDADRASKLSVQVIRSRHLQLSGLPRHYKQDVVAWLQKKGF